MAGRASKEAAPAGFSFADVSTIYRLYDYYPEDIVDKV